MAIEVLLAYCMEVSKEKLFLSQDQDLPVDVEQKFYTLLQRFDRGEPVAYLVKNKEFYGLDFYVDQRVLTPRPETELLVDKVLEFARGRGQLRILDVGTGSGCIAIALAKNLPLAEVHGSEVSEEALEVAAINAEKHGLAERVKFIQANLLTGISESYDVIVANLPYIGTEQFNLVSKETKEFEPSIALFGGKNGLFLYEKLFSEINESVWKPSLLLGEFGFLQGDVMRELLDQYFQDGQKYILNDYASIERVFMVYFDHKFKNI